MNQRELNEEEKIEATFNSKTLIANLKRIPLNTTITRPTENGKKLHIWRINENLFQARIEVSKSVMAPVVIWNESSYRIFPFPYIKGFAIVSVSAILFLLLLVKDSKEVVSLNVH